MTDLILNLGSMFEFVLLWCLLLTSPLTIALIGQRSEVLLRPRTDIIEGAARNNSPCYRPRPQELFNIRSKRKKVYVRSQNIDKGARNQAFQQWISTVSAMVVHHQDKRLLCIITISYLNFNASSTLQLLIFHFCQKCRGNLKH